MREITFYTKIIILAGIVAIGLVTLARLDSIMSEQDNMYYQIVVLQQDIVEIKESIESGEKLSTIDDYAPNTMYSLSLSDKELDIVCRIVMSEARGEPFEGMMAVAQVIRDRAIMWGKSVKEIALAPNQFAPPYQGEILDEAIMAVNAIFNEGVSIMESPTTHFHADYVSPYWAEKKVSRGTISRHLFYGE